MPVLVVLVLALTGMLAGCAAPPAPAPSDPPAPVVRTPVAPPRDPAVATVPSPTDRPADGSASGPPLAPDKTDPAPGAVEPGPPVNPRAPGTTGATPDNPSPGPGTTSASPGATAGSASSGTTTNGGTGGTSTGTGTRPAPPAVDPDADPRVRPEDRAARVGNRTIRKQEVMDLLLYTEGPKLLDLLIETEIARRIAAERGVRTDDADREAFMLETWREQLRKNPAAAGLLTDEAVKQVIANVRRKRGQAATDLAMERLYYMDRAARPAVRVDDEEVRREFDRVYGERVRLRCIQVNNLSEAGQVLGRLRAGEDFTRIAESVSRHPSAKQGGLCDAIPRAGMPPVVRAEIDRLKPGEYGNPVKLDDGSYIFRLEGRDAAQNVRFEQVAAELRKSVETAKVQEAMRGLLLEIQRRKVDVTYYDDGLKPEEK